MPEDAGAVTRIWAAGWPSDASVGVVLEGGDGQIKYPSNQEHTPSNFRLSTPPAVGWVRLSDAGEIDVNREESLTAVVECADDAPAVAAVALVID